MPLSSPKRGVRSIERGSSNSYRGADEGIEHGALVIRGHVERSCGPSAVTREPSQQEGRLREAGC